MIHPVKMPEYTYIIWDTSRGDAGIQVHYTGYINERCLNTGTLFVILYIQGRCLNTGTLYVIHPGEMPEYR